MTAEVLLLIPSAWHCDELRAHAHIHTELQYLRRRDRIYHNTGFYLIIS